MLQFNFILEPLYAGVHIMLEALLCWGFNYTEGLGIPEALACWGLNYTEGLGILEVLACWGLHRAECPGGLGFTLYLRHWHAGVYIILKALACWGSHYTGGFACWGLHYT